MLTSLIDLAYLLAAALFIIGLKRLTSPATARRGNQIAAVGMLIAVVATLFLYRIVTPVEMLIGVIIGSVIGVMLAQRVEMTSMPELVAALNGFGGLASALVAGAEIAKEITGGPESRIMQVVMLQELPGEAGFGVYAAVTIALSILIGMVTFSGSFVAFGKLGGYVSGNPIAFPGMRPLTLILALGSIASVAGMIAGVDAFATSPDTVIRAALGLTIAAFLLGILLVIPIGGADMPVVVALLNSYSGLAAAATGFVLDNSALIVSGALVGASGLILTKIMCEAMNRSLFNVLLGGFGGESGESTTAVLAEGKTVNETTVDDAAILLSYAQKVIIIPGYGMAVAQAQHQVRELADLLRDKGVEVKYAIHPVAGRMPGHMNVLLAEADVPYDMLFEMDEVNGDFDTTDVALVIGANDVVNPAARTDKSSPIYGMPILNADRSQRVIVLKRSMRPGYSGVENELFYNNNTSMLFGDAKETLNALVTEVRAV